MNKSVLIITTQIFLANQTAECFGLKVKSSYGFKGIEITGTDSQIGRFITAFSWRGHFKVLTVNG